jgi:hypothetical protein
MFFRTKEQARQWVTDLQLDAVALSTQCVDGLAPNSIRIALGEPLGSSYTIAKAIAKALGNVPETCLWITEYGIWPSRENWHLYYGLRRTYGDLRRLGEAPAHLFLDYETADLVTFLYLTLLFGWGGHVISSPSWTTVQISHDGWIVIEAEHNRNDVIKQFTDLGLQIEVRDSSLRDKRTQ